MIGLLIFIACFLGLGGVAIYGQFKNNNLALDFKRVNEDNGKLAECNFEYSDEVERLKNKMKLFPLSEEELIDIENAKSNVDRLIDKIENEMKVTNITCESHSEEYDKNFRLPKPLVTIELDNCIHMMDLKRSCNEPIIDWNIGISYHGAALTRLTKEHQKRLGKIFMEKMAEAAMNGPLPEKKMLPENTIDKALPPKTTEIVIYDDDLKPCVLEKESGMQMTTYKFKDNVLEAPSCLTFREVREEWSVVHPEIANAEVKHNEDGSITFVKKKSYILPEKEMTTYRFEDNVIRVSSEHDISLVRKIWGQTHHKIAIADVKENRDGSVTFISKSDTQITTYRYLDNIYNAPSNVSVEDVRKIWSRRHPELVHAYVHKNSSGSVTFLIDYTNKGKS